MLANMFEDEREEEEKMAKRAAAAAHPCEPRMLLTAEMTVQQIEEVRTSPRSSEGGTAEPQGDESAVTETSSSEAAGTVETDGEGAEKIAEEKGEDALKTIWTPWCQDYPAKWGNYSAAVRICPCS